MDCELHYHSFPMMIRRGHRLGQASGTTGAINCCPQLDGIGQCSRTGTPHQQSARLIVKLVGVEREVVDLVGRPVWCCNNIKHIVEAAAAEEVTVSRSNADSNCYTLP